LLFIARLRIADTDRAQFHRAAHQNRTESVLTKVKQHHLQPQSSEQSSRQVVLPPLCNGALATRMFSRLSKFTRKESLNKGKGTSGIPASAPEGKKQS